ncbi:MAG: hypothetical protein CM15mP75_0130 [Flammeovirgaceae bacterium]|nr:MAG: hypothetical protein CM15mP75_0130 [Flammeovirgaceae bacterium]
MDGDWARENKTIRTASPGVMKARIDSPASGSIFATFPKNLHRPFYVILPYTKAGIFGIPLRAKSAARREDGREEKAYDLGNRIKKNQDGETVMIGGLLEQCI